MINHLNLPILAEGERKECKFVIIEVSTGEVHFATGAFQNGSVAYRHKQIVEEFCEVYGFQPRYADRIVVGGEKPDGVSFVVKGGGLISFCPDWLVGGYASTDYGWAEVELVRSCIRDAATRANLHNLNVILKEMKGMPEPVEHFTIE